MNKTRLVHGLLRFCAGLPLRLNHALGAAIGQLHAWLPNRMRAVTRANLALCYPDADPAWRRALEVQSLRQTGRTLTEAGPLWLWPAQKSLALVHEAEGEAAVRAAYAAGRGVIILGPHLGAWELTGLWCAEHFPMTSLYAPPKQQALEDLIRKARQRGGARLVPTDAGGVRALMKALRQGEMVGILPDQEPRQGQGEFAPFFGQPAYTMVLASRLAQKTGAAVFYGFAERLPKGRGFRLHFLPADPAIADADPATSLAALNAGVERCIALAPDQYQWSYKRFRKRPQGYPSVYD